MFSTDDKPFEFTTLFHTYFRVPDVTNTTVSGLKGLTYVDKVQSYDKDCACREQKHSERGFLSYLSIFIRKYLILVRIIVSIIFKIKIVSKICFAITECLISHMLIGSFVS